MDLTFDIRKKGILVEQHRASPVVSYVEPDREELVVDILNRLLQGDNVSFSCNAFLDSTPLFHVEVPDSNCRHSFFEQKNGLVHCCRRNILEVMPLTFAQMPRGILRRPFERQPYAVLRYRLGQPSPTQ